MFRASLHLGTMALFVQIEFLCSSICTLPSNRANGVAVFEDSPIR